MEKDKFHFVYILKCKDASLYTGYTTNITRRLKMHESGKGAKYTRSRGPFELVFCRACASRSEALQLEAQIKKLSRKKKSELIQTELEGAGIHESNK